LNNAGESVLLSIVHNSLILYSAYFLHYNLYQSSETRATPIQITRNCNTDTALLSGVVHHQASLKQFSCCTFDLGSLWNYSFLFIKKL